MSVDHTLGDRASHTRLGLYSLQMIQKKLVTQDRAIADDHVLNDHILFVEESPQSRLNRLRYRLCAIEGSSDCWAFDNVCGQPQVNIT